ncbi:MAG TPA: DEAD/DEAH box helicase, partial [Thermoleophilia bacterium]|nr:DEAD/DEAH box helicase [Thermoleophilia bacterium]
QVEDDLQRRSAHLLARDADELHDVLRQLGDLTAGEAARRIGAAPAPPADDEAALAEEPAPPGGGELGQVAATHEAAAILLDELADERRAVRVRVGGEERWIAAEDAALYRDALGVVPPGGLPEAFLADVPEALVQLVRRYARTHGPFETSEVRDRWGVDPGAALQLLEDRGDLVRGELRPLGTQREWCDPDVLRRLRRASLAALRREIEPVDGAALARFAPAWQGVDRHGGAGAGADRLREVLASLQGLALAPELWERDVLPRRLGDYSPAWLDELCATGELVWVGAGATGRRTGKVALYFRDDAPLLGPPPARESPGGPVHDELRERLGRGACFFTDLLVDDPELEIDELREALWDLVWAGEATNDAFAPLRSRRIAPRVRPGYAGVGARRPGAGRFRRRPRPAPQVQGRWSLTGAIFAGAPDDPETRRRAWAELLLERHGIVTRELVRAEGVAGGFAALYPSFSTLETLGAARRGYFVEGLGGAQFALPGAVERLRGRQEGGRDSTVVLATADPAQLYGAALAWPAGGGHTPARRPGGYVVLVGGRPAVSVETGGRSLTVHDPGDAEQTDRAVQALAAAVRAGTVPRLAIEAIDGESALLSPLAAVLRANGFRAGPKRLTLARGD